MISSVSRINTDEPGTSEDADYIGSRNFGVGKELGMIVGNGLLASAFSPEWVSTHNAVLFASGVSNSHESQPEAFQREADLLSSHLERCSGAFIYFSTCSISDPDRAASFYAKHKLAMERRVAQHPEHLILRLPQVVGRTSNPNTLTNFLVDKLKSGQVIPIWTHALRCLVDVEHVAAVTKSLIVSGSEHRTYEIAPPETITMSLLVDLLEELLGVQALRSNVEKGGGAIPDPSLMQELAPKLGIDINPGYIIRLLQKYYGPRSDS